jgi:hypothetical protein
MIKENQSYFLHVSKIPLTVTSIKISIHIYPPQSHPFLKEIVPNCVKTHERTRRTYSIIKNNFCYFVKEIFVMAAFAKLAKRNYKNEKSLS